MRGRTADRHSPTDTPFLSSMDYELKGATFRLRLFLLERIGGLGERRTFSLPPGQQVASCAFGELVFSLSILSCVFRIVGNRFRFQGSKVASCAIQSQGQGFNSQNFSHNLWIGYFVFGDIFDKSTVGRLG